MNAKRTLSTLCILLAGAVPAYAVDTAKTYHSGILVLAFLGICALIVVVQLVPSLLVLFGWVKSLFRKSSEKSHQETTTAS